MVSTQAATSPPVRRPDEQHPHESEQLTLGLWLIIAFKAITALLLWGAFVLLIIAGREDPRNFVSILVFRTFKGNPPQMAIHFLVGNLQFISSTFVIRAALAIAAYALVESMEAIGLLLRKWWAEWLVILVTVSFIPLEVYEMALRPNFFKLGSLIVNLVILWYLLKRLLDKRRVQSPAILQQS